MKKFLLIFVLSILAAGVISAQELTLKEVITRSSKSIEETLPQRAKVIVLNFESPAKAFSDYVIDELSGELIEGKKITVVDRRNLSAIMDEMKFQYSGYVSDESMQSIGKMLGAQAVISGSLTDMGVNYRFRIRIINVETAAVQRQISLDLKKDTQVAYLLGNASAQQEMEKKRQETEKEQRKIDRANEPKKANARNNWISPNFNFFYNTFENSPLFGGSIKYEHMLNSNMSLGVNVYAGVDGGFNTFSLGIDAVFHFYPWGKTFFLGTALGYGLTYLNFQNYEPSYEPSFANGIVVTPEIGWKMDFGNTGGFYFQPGISGALFFGTGYKGGFGLLTVLPQAYLGIGLAF